MGGWWHHNRPILVSGLIYRIATAIGSTLRYKLVGEERIDLRQPAIYLMWHGRTFVPGQFHRGRGVYVIISHSRDGEMQNRIFQRLGYKVIRGSTGRGGERALVESIRVLRAGNSMAITPDGPRGPSGVVQKGVMIMAKKSGVPLIPVGASAKHRKLFRSWDRYMVPWPFSLCSMVAGETFTVPADADDDQIEQIRRAVEKEMHRLQAEAEQVLGHQPDCPLPEKEATT
ncbi:MAG TPA: lysophospholipid acyltransferase family protein [Fimbriimonadaceae bacterium]|nr:lysophospholipid acyltransferase family protein [Fimbriimonadaceae bacterium]